jgi:ribosomal protein S19E (S16A)
VAETSFVLLLLNALSHVSQRGIKIPDLQAQIREAVERGALPSEWRAFDASQIFHFLQSLAADGYVDRTFEGWVITPEGSQEAERLLAGPGQPVAQELENAAAAVA